MNYMDGAKAFYDFNNSNVIVDKDQILFLDADDYDYPEKYSGINSKGIEEMKNMLDQSFINRGELRSAK